MRHQSLSPVPAGQEDVEERARRLYCGTALAPMVRASTTPLRTLALEYGADFVYTEELIDRSLSNTTRVENTQLGTIDYVKNTLKNASKKHQKRKLEGKCIGPSLLLRLVPSVESGKLVCQIGTGEPHLALPAARHVYQDVDALDINMGCPKKFSVGGGMGSALLGDPERASRIIRTLRAELTQKPVSAKIRLLKDTASTLDFCQALVNAGVNAIAIHGRRVGDQAMHPAHWNDLREVVSLLRAKHDTLPILINGDFYTRQEWTEFMDDTGASGVLLARPALYNTSIFRKPTDASLLNVSAYGYKSPLLLDKTIVIQDYLRHACRYDAHYKNVKYVICEMMNSRRAPSPRVPYLPQVYHGDKQNVGGVCSCHSMQEICQIWNVRYSETKSSASSSLAGEHRYEDSYFLNDKTPVQQENPTEDLRLGKRPRLNEAEDGRD